MEPDELHELTAAYALGALDADGQREYEDHLRHCARCREELASFQEAAAALAYAVDAPEPPSRLREHILDQASRERTNVVPMRRRWVAPALGAAAAVAAAVAIGLGIWGSGLSDSLDQERAARAAQEAVLGLVADPGSKQFPVSGANGTLVVATDGSAGLVLADMPAAPDGKTYEAWVIEDGSPQAAGVFAGGGHSVVPLTRAVPAGATVAVTVEPAGGVEAPTGQPIAIAPTV